VRLSARRLKAVLLPKRSLHVFSVLDFSNKVGLWPDFPPFRSTVIRSRTTCSNGVDVELGRFLILVSDFHLSLGLAYEGLFLLVGIGFFIVSAGFDAAERLPGMVS